MTTNDLDFEMDEGFEKYTYFNTRLEAFIFSLFMYRGCMEEKK